MKKRALDCIELLCQRYPALEGCKPEIIQAAEIICNSYYNGGKLLVCGNGGSASDSMHIVGELMKGFVLSRKLGEDWRKKLENVRAEKIDYLMDNLQGALPAISLVSEVALSTAFSNDQASDLAFAQCVVGHGRNGDVLLGITTSGNSANVLYAADCAHACGMQVIGLAGATGGKLKSKSDVCICAPSRETYQIQEYHLPIYHALCLAIEEEFFGEA